MIRYAIAIVHNLNMQEGVRDVIYAVGMSAEYSLYS